MREKLRSSGGMTLTELIVALAVVSLIGVAMTVGISSAVKVHRDATQLYEAETLCGTILTSLEDEFRFARNVQKDNTPGSDKVIYDSRSFGNGVSVEVNDDGRVVIRDKLLLADKAYTSNLKVLKGKFGIVYDDTADQVKITVAVGPSESEVFVQHEVTVKPMGD